MRPALSLLIVSGLLSPASYAGQIVRDGTVGPVGPLTGPAFVIPDTDGQTRGNNLFHSFSQFDLSEGDGATFTGPANIQNILARVTGGAASTIDGTIDTTSMPTANFFFINPFGVVFGQHAQVNVSGSFAVTSADYVKLADGGRFDARNPANDVLTSAPPSAFGFLGPSAGPITLTGFNDPNNPPVLIVPDGKSIWLVGGEVRNEYLLAALSGEIVVVSVASAGELGVNVDDPTAAVDTTLFATLGNLTLALGGQLFVSGDPGGRAVLEADRIGIFDGGAFADNFGDTTGNGGIELHARTSIELSTSFLAAFALAGGDGGDVILTAPSIHLSNSSINTDTGGGGRAGNIEITASDFSLVQGGQVGVSTSGAGAGGNLVLIADHILIQGDPSKGSAPLLAAFASGGPPGSISVQANTVELLTGGRIVSDSTGGAFPGSDTHITAQTLIMDDQHGSGLTQISSRSIFEGSGGGNIVLNVDHLELRNGAQITTTTDNAAPAGNILIHGADVFVDTASSIASAANLDGAAGSVTLQLTGSLLLQDGGMLSVSAAQNAGGDINVTAGTDIRLVNGQISAQAAGDGGNVHLTTPSLIYLLNSQVTAQSVNGNGGNITIDPQFVVLDHSLISANAIVGNGGNIFVVSDFFLLSDSAVTASSEFGLQGSVTITAPDANLSGSLLALSGELLGAETLLRPDCAVKLPGGLSSFTVAGRGGVPVEPDGLLPAFATTDDEK